MASHRTSFKFVVVLIGFGGSRCGALLFDHPRFLFFFLFIINNCSQRFSRTASETTRLVSTSLLDVIAKYGKSKSWVLKYQ